jgi:hypothetical protein
MQPSAGGEAVLASEKTYWELGTLSNRSGTLVLTSERITLQQPGVTEGAAGPFGVWWIARAIGEARAQRKGQGEPNLFEIPLDQITAVRRGRRERLDKNALEIDAGGQTYRLGACFDSFAGPLRKALEARGHEVPWNAGNAEP